MGIIKHLSILLPCERIDEMHKALVRSHLDYCDITYNILSTQTQLDVILHGKVRIVKVRNWDGNP